MKDHMAFPLCLGLATGLHLLVWQISNPAGGLHSKGGGGDQAVSVMAASPQIAEMVARWDRPPQITADTPAMMAPPPPPSAADRTRPSITRAVPPPVADSTMTQPQTAYALPAIDQSVPRPEKRTTGGGQNSTAGQDQATAFAAVQAAADPGMMARWGGAIRDAILRRKRHPAGTYAHGTAQITITIKSNGDLAAVGITQSAGDILLDQAAKTAVQTAHLPSAPPGLAKGNYNFTLSVVFEP